MSPESYSDVAVVIPCFEHREFLATAVESALNQIPAPREIIAVDDGSTQDLESVTSAYPKVRLVRQEHQGPSAARNRGLKEVSGDKVLFLDADDVLLPGAIDAGLRCFRSHPDAAFVYGAFMESKGSARCRMFSPVGTHRDLVQCNWIGMIAAVLFDRTKLLAEGGFDEGLRMAEDWDLLLRLSRRFPFASHDHTVAEYRKHDFNTTDDLTELRRWTDIVRAKEWERGLDDAGKRAWHEGERLWKPVFEPGAIRPPNLLVRAARRAARLFAYAEQK